MSYFRLPKDTSFHKDWIHAAGHPIDNLPSKILICSDHFEEKYFDTSWKLKNELYYKGRHISRRLLPGSIPTLLPDKLAQRKEKVIYCFNKVVTALQATALLKKRSPS